MANEAKFTHISVSVDDDDDFVIQAGVSSAAPEPEPEPELAPAPEFESAIEPEPEPALEAPVAELEPAPVSKAPQSNQYRETTLEDLEVEKMSGIQKGVIGAAVIAIIAFLVWYLVL